VPETETPDGGVYEWYQRGVRLLGDGHPAAAVEPGSRSILKALGRAQYDAGRCSESMTAFTALVVVGPTDDYAHFGLGPAASRPDLCHDARALRGVRARQSAGPS
jgi:Flp pilus assembly protein TadD